MNYPSIEQVIAALGKHTENPEVISLLETLEISETDFEPLLDLDSQKLWTDSNNEIQIQFQDIGSLTDIPYHDIGEGPWVLTDVIFWSDIIKETKRSYGGPLPYGVDFSMSKKEVQALFSEPRVKDNERVDSWKIDDHRLVINYDPKIQKIRSISLKTPLLPTSE